jgi:hypothetical protein
MTRVPQAPSPARLARQRDADTYGVRQVGKPEPGFFKLRLVKGGPLVGARITHGPTIDPDTGETLDRSPFYAGEINGKPDPDPRPEPSDAVWKIWEHGERIGEDEYRFLIADRAWVAQHEPHRPEANPTKPVDLATLNPRLLL